MLDNELRRTEVGGRAAVWRFEQHIVRIIAVYPEPGLLTPGPDGYPELADARDRWPRWELVWNAVRERMWAELLSPAYTPHRLHGSTPPGDSIDR